MIKKWLGLEKRQSYTEIVVAALETAAAGGSSGSATNTAVVELAAGYWARGLSLTQVEPVNVRTRCLTAPVLSFIGRSLAKHGEAVFAIEFERGELVLQPASSWLIQGGPRRASWKYTLEFSGPTKTEIRTLPYDAVLHLLLQVDPKKPWVGVSPAQGARSTARLVGGCDFTLGNEVNSPSGYLLTVPDVGDRGQSTDPAPTDPFAKFRAGLRGARGSTVLAPATGGGFGSGAEQAPAPTSEYVSKRFGANPPEGLLELRSNAGRELLSVFGIVPAVFYSEAPSGTLLRDAWRLFTSLTLVPILENLQAQLSQSLDEPNLVLDASAARAADVTSLARGFRSLKDAGMSDADARSVMGI